MIRDSVLGSGLRIGTIGLAACFVSGAAELVLPTAGVREEGRFLLSLTSPSSTSGAFAALKNSLAHCHVIGKIKARTLPGV